MLIVRPFGSVLSLVLVFEMESFENRKLSRNFKCEICEKKFLRKGDKKMHIAVVHGSPKKHKCEHCEKSFTSGWGLKYHIQTFHEGQSNYKCDSCGKSFTGSQYLKKHNKTIHERQMWFLWKILPKVSFWDLRVFSEIRTCFPAKKQSSDWLKHLIYQLESCCFGGKPLELIFWLEYQKELTLVTDLATVVCKIIRETYY